MTHLIIVRPGAGYSPANNQRAFDECARKNGYTLETVGDSHLGHSFDRYPCVDINGTSWGTNCADVPPDHESFAEDTVAPLLRRRVAQGLKIVLIFGSRGGQVILPKLWQLGFNLPAIVINAGCARPEVHPPNSGGNLALISCSEDYFNTRNPAVVQKWIKNNHREGTAEIFILQGQGHMPRLNPDVINDWVEYCSVKAKKFKIDDVSVKLEQLHEQRSRQIAQLHALRDRQLVQLHKKHDQKLAEFLSTL